MPAKLAGGSLLRRLLLGGIRLEHLGRNRLGLLIRLCLLRIRLCLLIRLTLRIRLTLLSRRILRRKALRLILLALPGR